VKKVVIISTIFAIILGVAVWEIVFTVKIHSSILNELYSIEDLVGDTPQRVDTQEIIVHADKLLDIWHKNKDTLVCFGNHTVIRNVDEKLQFLCATLKNNDTPAAPAALKTAISLVEAISNDSLPVITNLL